MPHVAFSSISPRLIALLSGPLPGAPLSTMAGRRRRTSRPCLRLTRTATLSHSWIQSSFPGHFSDCHTSSNAPLPKQELTGCVHHHTVTSASARSSDRGRRADGLSQQKSQDNPSDSPDANPRPRNEKTTISGLGHSESSSYGTSSYIQCVGCGAVYLIESDELDHEPRVVRCCTCLHEWYACEDDLLWGEREAAAAIESSAKERSAASTIVISEGANADVPTDGFSQGPKTTVPKDTSPLAQQFSLGYSEALPNKSNRSIQFVSGVVAANTSSLSSCEASESTSGSDEDAGRLSCSIFVGNLSFHATEEDLFRAFSGYGVVRRCQIPIDTAGVSRGYGFVEMATDVEGELAIASLQGACILGRDICLSKARSRRDPGNFGTRAARVRQARSDINDECNVDGADCVEAVNGRGTGMGGRDRVPRRNLWNRKSGQGFTVRRTSDGSSNNNTGENLFARNSEGSVRSKQVGGSLTPEEEDRLNTIFHGDDGRGRPQRSGKSYVFEDEEWKGHKSIENGLGSSTSNRKTRHGSNRNSRPNSERRKRKV